MPFSALDIHKAEKYNLPVRSQRCCTSLFKSLLEMYPTVGGMPVHFRPVVCNRSHGISCFQKGGVKNKICEF